MSPQYDRERVRMIPERWQRVCDVVDAALVLEASERASFVSDASEGDDALRQEVMSLLEEQQNASDFLERPVAEAAVGVLAGDPLPSEPRRDVVDRTTRTRARWWVHLIAGSFLGYFGLVILSVYFPRSELSVRVRMGPANSLIVSSVTADSDAAREGVRPGDQIVAINGGRLRTVLDYRAFTAGASLGEAQTYLFERSGRRFAVPISPDRRPRFANLRFLPIHAGLLTSLILSLVVIYSRPDDRVAWVGALLLASAACASFPNWPTGLAGTWRHLPVFVGALLWPACLSSVTVGPIMFAFFALFPRRVIRRRWIWIASLTPAAVVTSWAGAYMMLVVYRPERSVGFYLPEWSATLGALNLPAYFVVGMAMLVSSYRRSAEVNERRRIRVLLSGMATAGVGLLYVSLAFIRGGGSSSAFTSPAAVVAGLMFVALPFSFAYAIIAQRLFDIRILIRQGLQYALARRSLLSLAPALVAGLVVDLMVHAERPPLEIGRERGWAYVTLAGFAALAYRRRDRWMTALDQRFFRERYDGQRILTGVIGDIRAGGSLEAVAANAVSRMSEAFHASFVALLVCEPRQSDFCVVAAAPLTKSVTSLTRASTLVGLVRVMGRPIDLSNAPNWLTDQLSAKDAGVIRRVGVDLVAPIITGAIDGREALLVCGRKRSEEPYTREDREFVTAVAESLALLLDRSDGDANPDERFTECPMCGVCDVMGRTRCAEDGTQLTCVDMPRVLARRYRLNRRLGRGGMGAVYEAHDGALERRVAVKVIRDDRVGHPDAADRFRREALAAASLTHPNVVTVYDFGIADNARGYLVMELLRGATVREALRRDGRFTPQRTLQVMRDVCHAVDTAHHRQLVHRDLKPDNIFLTDDEVAKVLDFGIAKLAEPAVVGGVGSIVQTAPPGTRPGLVLGTLGYMSPEQVQGGTPHPLWDIWALAVVTYEMLTGRLPFEGATGLRPCTVVAEASGERLTEPPPRLPLGLDSLFDGALSPDPAKRPAGALAFLNRFEQVVEGRH